MAAIDAAECRRLWFAVFDQALSDAFAGAGGTGLDRTQAISFLFDEKRISLWRQQREHISSTH